MQPHTLSHEERLRSLGAIRRMFEKGESGFTFPFRYVWYAESDQIASTRVLFSVPKKFHKRANKRNLLRRRTKEAYRLQKQLLVSDSPAHIDMALIYSSKEVLSQKSIAHAVRKILEQISEKL